MSDIRLAKLTLQLPPSEAAGFPELLKRYALINNAVHNISEYGVVEPVTFGNYLPKSHGGSDDEFSEWLLRVKNGKFPEFKNAADLLAPFIHRSAIIVTVPSSTAGKRNGIQRVAETLRDDHRLQFAPGALIRDRSVEASHLGGQRSVNVHLDTIRVGMDLSRQDRPILLLDDIFTTGCSMRACESLLLKAGVKDITFAAIGRTRHKNHFGHLEPLRKVV